MIFCLDGLEMNIKKAIEGLEKEFGFQIGENGETLSVEKSDCFFVQRKNGKCVIQFFNNNEIFVGLRYLLQTEGDFSVYPKRKIENLSVMCDCSRNVVMNIDSVKRFIRHLAIMGYNQLTKRSRATLGDRTRFGVKIARLKRWCVQTSKGNQSAFVMKVRNVTNFGN